MNKKLFCRIGKCIQRKEQASMTVEASYIVPMTLVCIIVMVFLMFYVYNQIALSADCYYLARKLSNVEIYEESYEFQEESKKVIKGNLVLPRNAQMLRKKGISNMVVTGEIEFYIPFMGTVAVNETQYACRKNNRKLLARYQQWKDVNIMGNQGQQKKEEIKK